MEMKKFIKKSKFLLLGLLVVAAFVGSTFAYLRATDTQIVNTFKFAKVETSIDEETGDTTPDNTATKLVKIKNNEVSPVFVRARVVVSGADAGVATVNYVASEAAVTKVGNVINVVYNSNDWLMKDGWFYYQAVLPGAEDGTYPETAALITSVIVGDGVDKSLSFEVDIYEESILTSGRDTTVEAAIAAFNHTTAAG